MSEENMSSAEIRRFLRKWSQIVLREAERISLRDRGETSEANGRWLKTKFRQASRNLE